MSEGTFRAVVAAVLVGALALTSVVAFALLQTPSPSPAPSATPTARPAPTATPTPALTPRPTPQLVFNDVDVTAVGDIPQGSTSGTTLVLQFTEPSVDAIPDAAGSFTVTLTDSAGVGATLAFTGTPSLDAPGSLGAAAVLVAPNVLKVTIVASDRLNIEPITVTGLTIRAAPAAALGPINAALGAFSGSLAGGTTNVALPSLGTVVAKR